MKKVFNDVNLVAQLFVKQEQYEAMTPLVHIQGRGKGRRLYFKGDTAYSYRDSFPLARIEGDKLYVKDFCPSITTKKHRRIICNCASNYKVIHSDDLKSPICGDVNMKTCFKKLLNAREWRYYFQKAITRAIDDGIYPITKSKFPILFNKEHDKLKQMLFSSDYETFNLARKIIKQQKLI